MHININTDIASWLAWVREHERQHAIAEWVLAADAVLGDTPWQITARPIMTPECCYIRDGYIITGPKWKRVITPE